MEPGPRRHEPVRNRRRADGIGIVREPVAYLHGADRAGCGSRGQAASSGSPLSAYILVLIMARIHPLLILLFTIITSIIIYGSPNVFGNLTASRSLLVAGFITCSLYFGIRLILWLYRK